EGFGQIAVGVVHRQRRGVSRAVEAAIAGGGRRRAIVEAVHIQHVAGSGDSGDRAGEGRWLVEMEGAAAGSEDDRVVRRTADRLVSAVGEVEDRSDVNIRRGSGSEWGVT